MTTPDEGTSMVTDLEMVRQWLVGGAWESPGVHRDEVLAAIDRIEQVTDTMELMVQGAEARVEVLEQLLKECREIQEKLIRLAERQEKALYEHIDRTNRLLRKWQAEPYWSTDEAARKRMAELHAERDKLLDA